MYLQEAETVTTSAQMVEVARSPMLDLPEQEGPRSSFKEKLACQHPSITFTLRYRLFMLWSLQTSYLPKIPGFLFPSWLWRQLQRDPKRVPGLQTCYQLLNRLDVNFSNISNKQQYYLKTNYFRFIKLQPRRVPAVKECHHHQRRKTFMKLAVPQIWKCSWTENLQSLSLGNVNCSCMWQAKGMLI